jgi:hypothetical protein
VTAKGAGLGSQGHVDVRFAVDHQAVHGQDFDPALPPAKSVVRRQVIVRDPVDVIGCQRPIAAQDHSLPDACLLEKTPE